MDNALIKQAQNGDVNAFEALYREFAGFVYNVSLKMMQNETEAKEVTQDVFLKVYSKLTSYRFESAFKTWLYRIAVNTALTKLRGKQRVNKVRVYMEDEAEKGVELFEENKSLLRRDDALEVDRLLEKLQPDHKLCLILRELEGLSYEEMSETMEIPLNTVRSRLKRAREAFIKVMQKEEVTHEMQ